jgi:iron complex outermembrane receptor protein
VTVARLRAEDEPRTMGEVVVTAPPVDAAAAREDRTSFATVIEPTTAPTRVTTLGEVLGDTVGVQVRRFGGLGDFSTVSIRGSSAGQVQVYLDGVPLSRADNEVVNLSNLPLDAVERVEVYRGTTPLGFAQSGPGGVVNVVTRRPGDVPITAASASYGSFETRKADLLRSERLGPWEYLAFAHYLGSQGNFRYVDDRGTTANPDDDRTVTRRNNAFDLGDLTARAGYRPGGPFSAMLTSNTFVKHEGVPGVGNVQALDTSLRTLRQVANVDLGVAPTPDLPVDVAAKTFVVYEQVAFDDPQGELSLTPEDTVSRNTTAGAQALARAAIGEHDVAGLFLGGSHEGFARTDRLADQSPPDRTRLRGTIAAENEVLLLAERLSIVPGVRWEIFRDDFPGDPGVAAPLAASGVSVRDFVSPRLGVRVRPHPQLTLLGNIGRYAREPNLSELFGDRGVLVGNPDLQPEIAINRDVGGRWTPPPLGPLAQVAVEYAWFDNSIDDLIVLVQNSQSIIRPENVTSASVQGHELSVRGRIADRIGLAANWTHQRARDDGDVTFLRGKQLPGRPADEVFAHAELAWSPAHPLPLGAAGRALWPGRVFWELNAIADNFLDRANVRRVGSRVLQDVGVEIALPWRGLRVTFEAKNVTDDSTRDVLGFPLPGRSFFVTLATGFGSGEEGSNAVRP